VEPEDAGRSVEEILKGKLSVSGRMIQRLARSGGFLLNGRRTHLSRKVRTGEVVSARVRHPEEPTLPPVPMALDVLYEDRDLLVVNKPAGVLVHPTAPAHTRTLAHGLASHLRERGVEARVRPVHRLDRDTSGAVLFALSAFSHQMLDRQLREGRVSREYLAIVEGAMESDEGVISAPIGRYPGDPTRRAVIEGGRPARTRFRVEARAPGFTVLRAWLESGRTHQLRVHLSHVGHPIAGDRVYGSTLSLAGLSRPALHAARIELESIAGESLAVDAPIPDDLRAVLESLWGGEYGSGDADDHALQQDDGEERDDRGEIDPATERQHLGERAQDRVGDPPDQADEGVRRHGGDEP